MLLSLSPQKTIGNSAFFSKFKDELKPLKYKRHIIQILKMVFILISNTFTLTENILKCLFFPDKIWKTCVSLTWTDFISSV